MKTSNRCWKQRLKLIESKYNDGIDYKYGNNKA